MEGESTEGPHKYNRLQYDKSVRLGHFETEDPVDFVSQLEQAAREYEEGTRPNRRARRSIRGNNTRLGCCRMAVGKASIDVDEYLLPD